MIDPNPEQTSVLALTVLVSVLSPVLVLVPPVTVTKSLLDPVLPLVLLMVVESVQVNKPETCWIKMRQFWLEWELDMRINILVSDLDLLLVRVWVLELLLLEVLQLQEVLGLEKSI